MDMEWAKDGNTNELFIVQARPETVQAGRDFSKVNEYLPPRARAPLVDGRVGRFEGRDGQGARHFERESISAISKKAKFS